MEQSQNTSAAKPAGILGFIEWIGNKLPDPIFLFISATAVVMAVSALGSSMGWSIQPQRVRLVTQVVTQSDGSVIQEPKLDAGGKPTTELVPGGAPVTPRNLLSVDGVYWLLANAVRNFINFAPLGVVLVGMFGIGVAEKVGLFGAGMRWVAGIVPSRALTPTIVFLGVMSNIASDAGYIILPPLAAALYAAFGRAPLAGIAAAFAGVSAGFSANLMVGSTDALVAGITTLGARTLEPSYTVLATANWWFLAISTVLLTIVGWAITAWIVEPRLTAQGFDRDAASGGHEALNPGERRALGWSMGAAGLTLAIVAACIAIPGGPLAGPMPAPSPSFGTIPNTLPPAAAVFAPSDATSPDAPFGQGPIVGQATIPKGYTVEAAEADGTPRGTFRVAADAALVGRLEAPAEPSPRWSTAVVPLIFIAFLVPGVVYGVMTGAIKKTTDVSKCFTHAMVMMAPVLAMAFFAAQFVECFKYTRLDVMLANAGGKALVGSGLPTWALLVGVVAITMVINLLMSSMSAKWTALAPILVPMLMMAGISPELTQAAYRVGDSCTNVVTPLNGYVVIILVAMQRWKKDAGIGNLMAMMLPYSIVFAIAWTILLIVWVTGGWELGPGAPLWYTPSAHHDVGRLGT
ncbi:MAG: AbgT family transporter [Phycisphaerales bacterium]|nr:AbgT family transporter [Phycisphaerales bacterium]